MLAEFLAYSDNLFGHEGLNKLIEGLKGAESVSDVINRLRRLRVVR